MQPFPLSLSLHPTALSESRLIKPILICICTAPLLSAHYQKDWRTGERERERVGSLTSSSSAAAAAASPFFWRWWEVLSLSQACVKKEKFVPRDRQRKTDSNGISISSHRTIAKPDHHQLCMCVCVFVSVSPSAPLLTLSISLEISKMHPQTSERAPVHWHKFYPVDSKDGGGSSSNSHLFSRTDNSCPCSPSVCLSVGMLVCSLHCVSELVLSAFPFLPHSLFFPLIAQKRNDIKMSVCRAPHLEENVEGEETESVWWEGRMRMLLLNADDDGDQDGGQGLPGIECWLRHWTELL